MAAPPFGVYVHVPFCARRCGYCDFNTYTAADLGGGAAQAGFADLAVQEITLARVALGGVGDAGDLASVPRFSLGDLQWVGVPAQTVFFGGGTPTVLPASDLVKLLRAVRDTWGLAEGAEVTTEANPESVDQAYLQALADGGFTRVSFGMQSSSGSVLAALGRAHRPEQVARVVGWALAAGLEVSVDLIYGTPGETMTQWVASVQAALALGVSHVSCYALTIEPGTPMGRDLAAGRVAPTDEADLADKYEVADEVLEAAGLGWYEISNWARAGHQCRHNLGYWQGGNWLGVGPGAHSAIGPVRFWNVTHPRDYARALQGGSLPVEDRELVTGPAAQLEQIMLGLRLSQGLPKTVLGQASQDQSEMPEKVRAGIGQLQADGLIEDLGERIKLTRRGRLLADAATRALDGLTGNQPG